MALPRLTPPLIAGTFVMGRTEFVVSGRVPDLVRVSAPRSVMRVVRSQHVGAAATTDGATPRPVEAVSR